MKYKAGYEFYACSDDWDRKYLGKIIGIIEDEKYIIELKCAKTGNPFPSYFNRYFNHYGDEWMNNFTRPLTKLDKALK